jgi:hypothetical protein
MTNLFYKEQLVSQFSCNLVEYRMLPDFKGHHFFEDSKLGEPPGPHHCERCGSKASMRPDGSVYFDTERNGVFLRTSNSAPYYTSRVPPCNVVRPRPA